ncbi:protein of unknown function [Candidatus Filomicrobium marinum]|uniref:Uncharacterized protein n=1 Tax=Candidatus Filomicrobium marinum TaxID=1608628 RepID=A0A0D6JER8_9HYPH|nr:protein of unknown function [Candidatus Filomicrobium marinum]
MRSHQRFPPPSIMDSHTLSLLCGAKEYPYALADKRRHNGAAVDHVDIERIDIVDNLRVTVLLRGFFYFEEIGSVPGQRGFTYVAHPIARPCVVHDVSGTGWSGKNDACHEQITT